MKAYPLPTTHYPLVVLVGPTASGKSELAVRLAKRFNGEIISADSRQIYKGMDLGTGKVPGKWNTPLIHGRELVVYRYKGVNHHLIDFVNPKRQYSVALFQREAKKIIADILKRGKLPIICGGTGHWIDAVVYNQTIPNVKPNPKLRKELQSQTTEELFARIVHLDPARAKTIDRHNKHRLIRALEIILTTGKPVPPLSVIPTAAEGSFNTNLSDSSARMHSLGMTHYDVLWVGIKTDQKILYQKIDKRLKQRLKAGMVKEVSQLHAAGLSWKKLESFGLEYKFIALYLQKKLSLDEMTKQLFFAIKHYSKRQLTWWKRNKEIKWINSPSPASKLLEKFLKV
jgi:tRNA dimethylallyltransferase